ncbi:winged helix-turn-helix domain-containing protein [Amycolatopsis sp. CA-128772]|uniref:AfsR/SARP family transcriptional regulator n=1 Tax=Amycolatopsis sp. CA-128772 TaxID=2073159 RepID=UPI001304F026|nr:winged helix-turn-helix domain-containing protein [Amycolatopsis sp. CA-128772]
MGEVSILLLGDVQVHAAAARVPLSGARQQKLLAALALAEGRLVTVSSLVDTVWNAAPPHTAVRQVRNLVTALRRTLVAAGAPESVIVAEGAGFRMDLTGLRCDVVDFDALAKAGDRRAALRLWRGPAWPGWTARSCAGQPTRSRNDVFPCWSVISPPCSTKAVRPPHRSWPRLSRTIRCARAWSCSR